jgi:hypothetical protein
MKKTVEISQQTAAALDAVRGNMPRSKYLDALLKKYQGVTLSHTPANDPPKKKKKPIP